MKNQFFDKFSLLVKDQWLYGGKKYALAGKATRESTDVLFDKYGKAWLFGTMDKYVYRNRNLKRERDILKIACYSYILWLKRGFHIHQTGINDPALDTAVEQKEANWDKFLLVIDDKTIRDTYEVAKGHYLDYLSQVIERSNSKKWKDISQLDLIHVFTLCYSEWFDNYKDAKQPDTDTYGEKK